MKSNTGIVKRSLTFCSDTSLTLYRIGDLFVKLAQLVFEMGDWVSIGLTLIREVLTKPHTIQSVSELDSSNKCELFRKLLQIGSNVSPLP